FEYILTETCNFDHKKMKFIFYFQSVDRFSGLTIYTQLVPTSQVETAQTDLQMGSLAPGSSGGTRDFRVQTVPSTKSIPIDLASRGNTYIAQLLPLPKPGTITVDYMAEGSWYRLHDQDDGSGLLEPDIPNTGTGRIDYTTGTITITTAALPDVNTPVIIQWGNPFGVIPLDGELKIDIPSIYHKLAHAPVKPGSLSITWPVGANGTAAATDVNGKIMEGSEEIGWINYGNGEMEFAPKTIPNEGGEYTFDYQKYDAQQGTARGTTFTLPHPLKPGSVYLEVPVSAAGVSHVYKMRDDGQGKMSAPGWSASTGSAMSVSGYDEHGGKTFIHFAGTSSSSSTNNNKHGTVALGGITATVDYITGVVVLDMSKAGGEKHDYSTTATKFESTASKIPSIKTIVN
ncbi:MAG: hypothetical protein CSB24_04665, partial [Deltaproteobacteria bacterium]